MKWKTTTIFSNTDNTAVLYWFLYVNSLLKRSYIHKKEATSLPNWGDDCPPICNVLISKLQVLTFFNNIFSKFSRNSPVQEKQKSKIFWVFFHIAMVEMNSSKRSKPLLIESALKKTNGLNAIRPRFKKSLNRMREWKTLRPRFLKFWREIGLEDELDCSIFHS